MNQLKLEFLDIFSHCQHCLLYQLRHFPCHGFAARILKAHIMKYFVFIGSKWSLKFGHCLMEGGKSKPFYCLNNWLERMDIGVGNGRNDNLDMVGHLTLVEDQAYH